MPDFENKLIEVCDKCHRASCWHGEFLCEESAGAGTILKPVSELRLLALEHEKHWSDDNLAKIYGDPAPHGFIMDSVPWPHEYPWPDPKPEDIESKDFKFVWECVKSWDINVPEVYTGYSGATGNHVMSILFATGKRSIQDYI